MKKITCLLLGLSLALCSCSRIIFRMMGLHENKILDQKTILAYSEKNKIPAADNFRLDTTYLRFLKTVDTLRFAAERKNHYQPLQALYYDGNGTLRAFIINCYTGGFPNLKWNRGKVLDTFLPGPQAPLDSILPLYEHLKYLKPLPGAQRFSYGQNEYIIIVYWSHFMGRQGRRLIEAIKKNVKLAGNKKVRVIYVNTDNFFAKLN